MSDILRVRLPNDLKNEAANLYDNLGITLTQAVKMFFKQSVIDGGLPFQPRLKQPNTETLAAIEEVESGKTIKANGVSSIFEDLDDN